MSKQALLDTVWSDTVVSDQVVFQSINEIRQLFPEQEVIKTIPKKGYVWLPKVKSKQTSSFRKYAFATLLCLVTITLVLMLISNTSDPNPDEQKNGSVQGSVVVLPIENHIEGNDHNWVSLGMMDQIIQRLPNASDRLVLQTDYVFDVLKRANAPKKGIQFNHIQQLFKVSGAELVILGKLGGVAHDYKLNYAFYYRDGTQKGVLIDGKIQTLVDQFSVLIASKLGDGVAPIAANYQSDFNNELLGNAIEKQLEWDFEGAEPLLKSIVQSDPENITAQRMLIGNHLRLRNFEKVGQLIDSVLPMAQQANDDSETTRLLYLKTLLEYVNQDHANSLETAKQALAFAKKTNDWLIMAYIKNTMAASALSRDDFQLAKSLYQEEMDHHRVLRCPSGEAGTWADLAHVAKLQKDQKGFDSAIEKAISIARNRDLASQLEHYEKIRDKGIN